MFLPGFGATLGRFVRGLSLSRGEDLDWESSLLETDNPTSLERMSADGRFGFSFNTFTRSSEKASWSFIEVWGLFTSKEKLELLSSSFLRAKGEGDLRLGLRGLVFVKFSSVYSVCGGKSDPNSSTKLEDSSKLSFALTRFTLAMEREPWSSLTTENPNGLFESFDKPGNAKALGVKPLLAIL